MKRMSKFVVGAIVAAGAIGIAGAGEILSTVGPKMALENADIIKAGDYRELTWSRKVKLGTAGYVNPGLLKHARVVYRFDSEALAERMTEIAFHKMLVSGKIGIAELDPSNVYKINARPHIEKTEPFCNPTETGFTCVIVSSMKELSGVRGSGLLVSWHAVDPIVKVQSYISPPTAAPPLQVK